MKEELTDIMIKILDENGYIDGYDKNIIKNQISILFEDSDRQVATNNSIFNSMELVESLDGYNSSKLKYTGKDINELLGIISKVDTAVGHIDRIYEIYDNLNNGNYTAENLKFATELAIDEIGAIFKYVPVIGDFIAFEMDLLKYLFQVESDLVQQHI